MEPDTIDMMGDEEVRGAFRDVLKESAELKRQLSVFIENIAVNKTLYPDMELKDLIDYLEKTEFGNLELSAIHCYYRKGVYDSLTILKKLKGKSIDSEDVLTDEEKYRVQALHSKTTWNS